MKYINRNTEYTCNKITCNNMKQDYLKRLSQEAREKLLAEIWMYNLIP